MTPVSSASGMNSAGETLPRFWWCQRASASNPTILPDCNATMGWYCTRSSPRSMARRRSFSSWRTATACSCMVTSKTACVALPCPLPRNFAVSARVVDDLEAVQVEEEDGEAGAAAALRSLERHAEALHEERAVGQPGERVVEGGVPELLLGSQPLGDVHADREAGGAAGEVDVVPGDFDVDDLAIRLAMPADVRSGRILRGLGVILDGVIFGTDVGGGHPQELLAAVPVPLHGGVVHREEAQGVGVEDPHRLRARVEEQPIPLFARAQRLEDAVAVGHVADRGPECALAAILDRSGGDLDDDVAAVPAAVTRFEDAAQARRRLVETVAIHREIGEEPLGRASHQFRAGMAIQLARMAIGVEDGPVLRVHDDDGVVGVLEERAVVALAPSQLVLGGLALEDVPELGADHADDVEQLPLGLVL